MLQSIMQTLKSIPGVSTLVSKMKKHPLIAVIAIIILMNMGITPSVIADTATDLIHDTTEVADNVVQTGASLGKAAVDTAADMAADTVAMAEEAVGSTVVGMGSRKGNKNHLLGKYTNTYSPYSRNGSRKAAVRVGGKGLYGESRDSDCMGQPDFGADRLQCSHINLPVSHSVRPHPLVQTGQIDSHYDGATGVGTLISSAFHDNKSHSKCAF
jgi:hypothetical protein